MVTDSSGYFFLAEAPLGTNDMIAYCAGFDTLNMRINIASAATERWYDIFLFPPGERERGVFISSMTVDDDN
jgi:hypothetical protein